MYFFENRYSPRRRFNPVHSPSLSASPPLPPSFLETHRPIDLTTSPIYRQFSHDLIRNRSAPPPPSVTRTFTLPPRCFSFPRRISSERSEMGPTDRSIETGEKRGRGKEGRSIPIIDRPGVARARDRLCGVEGRRWKEGEERQEETRDARRQGVIAFQLDSTANGSADKGNIGGGPRLSAPPRRIAKYFISYPSKRLISAQVRARESRCTRVCASSSMATIQRIRCTFSLSPLSILGTIESILHLLFLHYSNPLLSLFLSLFV